MAFASLPNRGNTHLIYIFLDLKTLFYRRDSSTEMGSMRYRGSNDAKSQCKHALKEVSILNQRSGTGISLSDVQRIHIRGRNRKSKWGFSFLQLLIVFACKYNQRNSKINSLIQFFFS